jgi:hypothetical protein
MICSCFSATPLRWRAPALSVAKLERLLPTGRQ